MKVPVASSVLLLSLFCVFTSANILGNETDRLSLLAFKDGITQDPLQVLTSWNTSTSFCDWEGVACSDQHGRVIALNLESRGLMGSISPHIGNLSFLRSINLQNNSLQGTLPLDVGRLTSLEVFRADNNSILEQIPGSFSNCSNLMNLSLSYNKLVGKIPAELGHLSNLVELRIYANQLTGQIPESFANLSALEILVLGRNNLHGSIPESLGRLRRLVFFWLGENSFSGTVPPLLYNISSLESISVPLNQLQGSLPSNLGLNLPNLRGFYFGGNRFSGIIPPSFISNVSRLQRLGLSFNNFHGKVPVVVGLLENLESILIDANNLGNGQTDDLDFITSLSNCSKLRVLSMALNHFGGALPRSITKFSSTVTELYLGGSQISGIIPSAISNLNNLVVLTLEDNLLTGIIPESIGMLGKLQLLSLAGNKFSGVVPNSIGNASQLYYLDFSDNNLEGNMSSLEKCQSLQKLNLSYNNLNGVIPKQLLIGLSGRLTTILLAHNSLVGPLPSEVGTLKNLQSLDLSGNKLSGEIPLELGSCLSLEKLYLQDNIFQGVIPSSFEDLKILQQLDLSQNNLSGRIPNMLGELSFLNYLNLSFNDFEGEVPIEGLFQNTSAFSAVGNDKLCGGISKLDLIKCQPQKSDKQGISLALKVTLGLVIPILFIASLLLVLYWVKKRGTNTSSKNPDDYERFRLKTISYNDLRKATDGFSSNNLIGVGSCGSVYIGVLHHGEKLIAVKVLNIVQQGVSRSFMRECEILRNVRHRNLLKILNVCSSMDHIGNDFKALVFEFMPNGTVDDWLHPRSEREDLSRSLNLLQRINIAIDVASALDYLHNHCEAPIVHCDIKPSNILLDDNMVAHVADFGLAKFLPKSTSNLCRNDPASAALIGTIGYIPPEYGMGVEVSTEGDVYSYGLFLLEMLTGKRPTDDQFKDGLSLHQFCKLALSRKVVDIEGSLEGSYDTEEYFHPLNNMHACMIYLMQLGVSCSSGPIDERMDINDVLTELHGIKERCFRDASSL